MNSHTLLLIATTHLLVAAPRLAWAQDSNPRLVVDSSARVRQLENEMALIGSGVWQVDGEYKAPTAAYFKLTGYFAYVKATSTSRDDGDRAVIAMYLEPMAGGRSLWISASLVCASPADIPGTRCAASEGATQLLDLNFVFKTVPIRGSRIDAELFEPDDKSPERRWTSRSTSRGRFALVPP